MNLGTRSAQWGSPLGVSPRRIEASVIDDQITIGFRTDGRLLVAYATPAMVEIREYGRGGKIAILGSYPGGRQIACEEVAGMLVFRIDGDCAFSAPAGKSEWTLYDGRA